MPKGGLYAFFFRLFDVSEYRKTSKRNPSVFHRVFCIERFYEKEGGKGVSVTISRQNCFCLTVPNHFQEETFCVSESFGYLKCLCLRGDYPRFSMENLLSPVPKNFVEEPICVSQTFLYRKFLGIRGGGKE